LDNDSHREQHFHQTKRTSHVTINACTPFTYCDRPSLASFFFGVHRPNGGRFAPAFSQGSCSSFAFTHVSRAAARRVTPKWRGVVIRVATGRMGAPLPLLPRHCGLFLGPSDLPRSFALLVVPKWGGPCISYHLSRVCLGKRVSNAPPCPLVYMRRNKRPHRIP
jgi:hypothetical protein